MIIHPSPAPGTAVGPPAASPPFAIGNSTSSLAFSPSASCRAPPLPPPPAPPLTFPFLFLFSLFTALLAAPPPESWFLLFRLCGDASPHLFGPVVPLSLEIGIENWQHSHIGNTFRTEVNVANVEMAPISNVASFQWGLWGLRPPAEPSRFPVGSADGGAPSPSYFLLSFARVRGLTPDSPSHFTFPRALFLRLRGGGG